ncbi:MAG: hypothetical protein KIH01_05815 [Candidatus Freyarchaeota archaeon]|nr:hypothetical protein [Candidatus Jordarchaeia archaeon]
MPRRGVRWELVGLLFALLMLLGLLIPALTVQTTLFGTVVDLNSWFGSLESIVCLVGGIIGLIGVFLTFVAGEYAINDGLAVFGSSVTLTASLLYISGRIGSSINLLTLKVPYAYYFHIYRGEWQYTVLYRDIPIYLATLQIPLGPIITCLSALMVVILFLALLGGYWRRR